MASGTIYGTTANSYITARIVWSSTTDTNNNTSTVTATLSYKKDATYSNATYSSTFTGSITINGNTNTIDKYDHNRIYLYSSAGWVTMGSHTVTVSHNNDGTKAITISATGKMSGTSFTSTSLSGTATLDTIPRESTITSASNITLGNACSIKWTPMSSSFKYKIKFSLGSWNYTTGFITPNTTSAYTYTGYTISGTTTANSTTIYAQLPSSTSGAMTAVLTTYNSSGTAIGSTSSKTFTVTIPSSVVPSIGAITLDPVNITTADGTSRNILVKGKNKLAVSVSGCAAGTGSSISSYAFSGTNISSTVSSTSTSASATSNVVSTSGTLTYTVKITDKRGRTTSKSATITCYDYTAPEFSSFTAYRCNSSGTASDSGTYIKYELKTTYASVNSTNKNTIKIYYRKSTSSTWISAANALTSSTTKSAAAIIKNSSGTAISSFDADSTYLVYAVLTDNYSGSVQSAVINVFGASRILNVRKSGTGIAFGKMAESDSLFEVKWALKVDDQITFGEGTQGKLYNTVEDGRNIICIQTGQSISGGTTMGLSLHAGSQSGSAESSTPCVFVQYSENSGLVNLGGSGRKWNQLYAANGTISTSDKNVKTNISDMADTQEQLFNKLRPVTFEFINGSSGRTHYGFISQDVEDSLSELGLKGKDFAGFCKDLCIDENGEAILDESGSKTYDYALRYSEFIALNTYMIQKLQNKITELEAEIAELKQN